MFFSQLLKVPKALITTFVIAPPLLILSALGSAMPEIEAVLAQLKSTFRLEDSPIELQIRLLEQVKTYVKANNIASKHIRLFFSIIRCALACNNFTLIDKGYKLFRYILSRLSLQGYAHHSATQGRKLYPILYARLQDPNKNVRDGAAQSLVHYWNYIPPHCFAIEFRFFAREYLVGQPLQASHLCVDTIVSKLHNEEGHLIIEEELLDHRDVHEINDQEATKAMVNVSVDIEQPKTTRATKASEGEDIVAPTSHSEAHDIAHISTTEIGSTRNQLPLANGQSAHNTELTRDNTQSYARNDVPTSASLSNDATANSTLVAGHPPSIVVPALPAYTPRPVNIDQSLKSTDIPTSKQLVAHTKDMKASLEMDDKNSESTWKQRFADLNLLRAITKGNAPAEFRPQYLDIIKILIPGILKCVNSPRTVLSSLGCTLLQEMAATLNSDLDPHTEIILSETIKLCGSTKKIISENGGVTVDVVFAYVSYNGRYFRHVSNACEDKNFQTRVFAAKWLKTIILHHRLKIEHAGNLDIPIKCITKGLSDANPSVRDNMRSTFWTFSRIWPQHGATIFQKSDSRSQARLTKDDDYFNLIDDAASVPAGRPTSQRGTTEPPRSQALRQTIRAAKRPVTAGHADSRPKQRPQSSEDVAGPSTNRPASAMSLSKPAPMTSRGYRPPIPRPNSAMSAHKGKMTENNDSGSSVGTLRSAPVRFASRPTGPNKAIKPLTAATPGPRRMFDKRSTDDTSSHRPMAPLGIPVDDPHVDEEEKTEKIDDSTEIALPATHDEPETHEASNATGVEAIDEHQADEHEVGEHNASEQSSDEHHIGKHQADEQHIDGHLDEPQVEKHHPDDEEAEKNESFTEIVMPPTTDEPESSQAPVERQKALRRRSSGIPRPIKVYQDPRADDHPATPGSASVLKPKQPQAYYHSRFAATPWTPFDIPPDYEEQRPQSPLKGVGKLTDKDRRVTEQAKRLWDRKNSTHEQNVVTPLNRDLVHLGNQLNQAAKNINDRTVDMHGYYRIYGIVREISGLTTNLRDDEHVFNVLIAAALECLISPVRNNNIDDPAAHAVWSRDTQYLLNLISEVEKTATEYVDPAVVLPVLIQLRGTIKQHDAIVHGIEELVLRLSNTVNDASKAIEYTLQAVQGEIEAPGPHHGTVMGLMVLGGLLDRLGVWMESDMKDALTNFAHRALRDRSASKEDGETTIGRATICFIQSLARHFGAREEFVKAVTKGSMAHKEVLDFYFA